MTVQAGFTTAAQPNAAFGSCYKNEIPPWGAELLLMLQQFMSRIAIFPFGSTPYSCRAFTANSRKARSNGGGQSTPWVTDFRGVEDFRLIAPCSLTLIYCSLINRLTLAAAFAAAFFMGGGFVTMVKICRSKSGANYLIHSKFLLPTYFSESDYIDL